MSRKENIASIPEILNLDMLRGLNEGKIRIITIPVDDYPLYEEAANALELDVDVISEEQGDLFLNAEFVQEGEDLKVRVRLDSVRIDHIVFGLSTPKKNDFDLFNQALDFLRQAQRKI